MVRKLAATGIALALIGPATAEAAVKAGVYRGTTEQQAKVQLKVLSSKKAVVKFFWEGAVLGCTDGNVRQLQGFTSPSSLKIPLSRTGRFRLSAGPADGSFEFVTLGRVNGNRATGALQVQARVNEQGSLDPAGSIVCDSEIVQWSARRR